MGVWETYKSFKKEIVIFYLLWNSTKIQEPNVRNLKSPEDLQKGNLRK